MTGFIGVFLIFIQIVPAIGFLGATLMYGECQQFDLGHTVYDAKTCHYCTTFGTQEYCRTYLCRPVNCTNPVTTNSCCPSCPGTCNYDGQIIPEGQRFRCEENTSLCMCGGTGLVIQLLKSVLTRNGLDSFCHIGSLVPPPYK